MLPHGPRPTTIAAQEHRGAEREPARRTSARSRRATAGSARPTGRRAAVARRALPRRRSRSPRPHRPAGRRAPGGSAAAPVGQHDRVPDVGGERRAPRGSTPDENRTDENSATGVSSGDRRAAGLGARRRLADRHRAGLDLEDEPAVRAGIDDRRCGPGRTSGRPPTGRRRRARSAASPTGRSARRGGRTGGRAGRSAGRRCRSRRAGALRRSRPSPVACAPGTPDPERQRGSGAARPRRGR